MVRVAAFPASAPNIERLEFVGGGAVGRAPSARSILLAERAEKTSGERWEKARADHRLPEGAAGARPLRVSVHDESNSPL